jgi:16S rRNA (guanine966-N2)-methyltransferase
MELRIIAGTLGRRRLHLHAGSAHGFRPTGERIRGAVANILGERIIDAQVADICAGSGAYGFELLSRGAAHVDFIESDHMRWRTILQNADELGVSSQVSARRDDVKKFIEKDTTRYDIITYDPPYDDTELALLAITLITKIKPGGVLVYERKRKQPSPALPLDCYLESREYGDTVVDFIFKSDTASLSTEQDPEQ